MSNMIHVALVLQGYQEGKRSFSEVIRQLSRCKTLSEEELSKHLGVPSPLLKDWQQDKNLPNVLEQQALVRRILTVLEVNLPSTVQLAERLHRFKSQPNNSNFVSVMQAVQFGVNAEKSTVAEEIYRNARHASSAGQRFSKWRNHRDLPSQPFQMQVIEGLETALEDHMKKCLERISVSLAQQAPMPAGSDTVKILPDEKMGKSSFSFTPIQREEAAK